MICEKYLNMTPLEQRNFIGALVHSVIHDELLFSEGEKLIKKAEKKGLFQGVTINPATVAPPTIDNIIN